MENQSLGGDGGKNVRHGCVRCVQHHSGHVRRSWVILLICFECFESAIVSSATLWALEDRGHVTAMEHVCLAWESVSWVKLSVHIGAQQCAFR